MVDRDHHRRTDPVALSAYRKADDVRVAVFWKDLAMTMMGQADGPWLVGAEAIDVLQRFDGAIFLGTKDGCPIFAVDLPVAEGAESPPDWSDDSRFVSLRHYAPQLTAEAASILAYGQGMALWHRNHRFCGVCGAKTVSEDGGHVRRCTSESCRHPTYPRTDPAVIMLVEDGDRILLHRQRQWPVGMWSCLAGFVEPGETLENAVRREVMEESGILVDGIGYAASQPWPFPSSLMIAFTARAVGGVLSPDRTEIEDARWFSTMQLAEFDDRNRQSGDGLFLALPGSAARYLIDGWMSNR